MKSWRMCDQMGNHSVLISYFALRLLSQSCKRRLLIELLEEHGGEVPGPLGVCPFSLVVVLYIRLRTPDEFHSYAFIKDFP